MNLNNFTSVDSTTSIDFNLEKDLKDMNDKIVALEKEKDELEKENRKLKHEHETNSEELKIENEKLKKTNQSLEALLESLKKTPKVDELAEKDKVIYQKDKINGELESKILLLETSLQDYKRQAQNLNMENSSLKIEIEKLNLQGSSNSTSVSRAVVDEEEGELTLEEAKQLLSDFMTENDELKKEKAEMGEKALEMLTQKEMENLEVKEKFDAQIQGHRNEVNALLNEIQDLKDKILELDCAKVSIFYIK